MEGGGSFCLHVVSFTIDPGGLKPRKKEAMTSAGNGSKLITLHTTSSQSPEMSKVFIRGTKANCDVPAAQFQMLLTTADEI